MDKFGLKRDIRIEFYYKAGITSNSNTNKAFSGFQPDYMLINTQRLDGILCLC